MRTVLRVLASLLGLGIGVAGLLVVVETVGAWWAPGSSPVLVPWPGWRLALEQRSWEAIAVRLVAVGLLLGGLALAAIALGAGRRQVYLLPRQPGVTMTTSPRVLARLVAHHLRTDLSLPDASVSAGRRALLVKVTSESPTPMLREAVAQEVQSLLADLPLARTPSVRVQVSAPKEA